MVIGYQVDKFKCMWSLECLSIDSEVYPGIPGKVSILAHFSLEVGCEDYAFQDQALKFNLM